VTQRERGFDAPIRKLEPAAAPQVVVTLPQVKIGMAKSGRLDPQQNFGSSRLGIGSFKQFKWLAVVSHAIAAHRMFLVMGKTQGQCLLEGIDPSTDQLAV
jgi:hypothetical protein